MEDESFPEDFTIMLNDAFIIYDDCRLSKVSSRRHTHSKRPLAAFQAQDTGGVGGLVLAGMEWLYYF